MAENDHCSNGLLADPEEEMTLYRKNALSVVTFNIVYDMDSLHQPRKECQFKPDMAHQVFGESESIFGYRSLSIDLYYLHNSSRCFIDLHKSGEINRDNTNPPDDIMKCLNPWMPENYTIKKSVFRTMLEKEQHDIMFGTVLHEFKDKYPCKLFPESNIFANYKVTLCDISDENFTDYHKRFETFIIWFIDAANFIDLEDERWMIFYVYEEFEHPDTNKTYRSPVGFCSAYKFYAYPNNIRARISQFFVLPTHQKRGIGSQLYQTIVKKIKDMPEVIDITVEEPTPTFQKIRDIHDFQCVYTELKTLNIDINTTNQKRIYAEIKKHKICKKQCQRIFDIIGCFLASKISTGSYKNYVNDIKSRIKSDIERETRGSKRLCNLERAGISEPIDKSAQIESEFKRYIDDITPSIKYLQLHEEIINV